jgi:Asp-tRNA(Asn)/Glu-tRNA(Gln) amidotransferase A subunit family amidase
MLHQEITDTSATALAALVRTKQLSSREVVQAHLDRVHAVNPQINAVVTLMAEQALASADVADRAVTSGAPLGPLHGVPFSIKDSLDTAGFSPSAARSSSPATSPTRMRQRLRASRPRAGLRS